MHINVFKIGVVIILMLVASDLPAKADQPSLKADSAIQEQIKLLASKVGNTERSEAPQLISQIVELKIDNPDMIHLLRQILLAQADDQEGALDMRYGIVVKYLFPLPRDIIVAFLPYTNADNKAVRDFATAGLRQLQSRETISQCASLLRGKPVEGWPSHEKLIEWMFESNPGEAFVQLAFVLPNNERRQLLLNYREIDNWAFANKYRLLEQPGPDEKVSQAAIELASNETYWWARLYVAQIMQQYPDFRQYELVEMLKDDKHTVVRETIESIPQGEGSKQNSLRKLD